MKAQCGLNYFIRYMFFGLICFFCLCATVRANNVYEKQAPFSEKELTTFIQLLPQFRTWSTANKEVAHPKIVNNKADFIYSKAAENWVKQHKWDARRFFSIMGKAAAALYIISEGSHMNGPRPKDMPNVTQAEIDLVQRHLSKILEAGKNAMIQ